MRFVTNLMDRIFSDSTPEEFKDKVSEKIDEAKANGSAELKDEDNHLSFAESNGDVVIEDKKNGNEVTVAKEDNGEYKLEGVPATKTESATEPDAHAEVPKGETKPALKEDSTLKDADVNNIKAVVISEDKAGVGKHFSLKFEGFKSEAEAQQFFSDLHHEEDVISFSDAEIAEKAEEANELNKLAERVEGTGDPKLAAELKQKAEELKAYSILAAGQGYEMGDLIDVTTYYSDYADEALNQAYSEMDVNEFFSDMSEEEVTAYFSELGEVESEMLYSALADEENNYTFSDVQEAIDNCYSEIELSTPLTEYFSEMSEDEINQFFSTMSEDEVNTVFSVLEENENATFSDINEVLELNSTPMTELFSDMSEDELKAYSEQVGEDVANVAFSMAVDEDENYTYSDFLDVMEYMTTYSDEDVEQLSKNADEIGKAAEDMKSSEDAELAKKVKVLADATAEEAEAAKEQGVEGAAEVCDKCHSFSAAAEDILIKGGINPKSVDADKIFSEMSEASKEEPKDQPKDGETPKDEPKDQPKDGDNPKDEPKDQPKDGETPKDTPKDEPKDQPKGGETEIKCDKSYSYLFQNSENRTFSTTNSKDKEETKVFGKVNETGETKKSVNPYLFSKIN